MRSTGCTYLPTCLFTQALGWRYWAQLHERHRLWGVIVYLPGSEDTRFERVTLLVVDVLMGLACVCFFLGVSMNRESTRGDLLFAGVLTSLATTGLVCVLSLLLHWAHRRKPGTSMPLLNDTGAGTRDQANASSESRPPDVEYVAVLLVSMKREQRGELLAQLAARTADADLSILGLCSFMAYGIISTRGGGR